MADGGHFVEIMLLLPTLIILTLSVELVYAQSPFSPFSTGSPASVFIEGKALYIQGGSTQQQNVTSQTFSISLSSSWNTLSPTYTKLLDGLYDSQFPNTLLDDGVTWFALSNNTFFTYNILDGKITRRAPATIFSNFTGLNAMFDRGLGEVIIPNGYNNGQQTTNLYINPGSMSFRVNPTYPLSDISALSLYSLAWSASTQKTYLFGGWSLVGGQSSTLYQRSSSTEGNWNRINTTLAGSTTMTGPSPRQSSCLVPAFNGAKLILFGGLGPISSANLSLTARSDIFIYDVAKAEWTQGADAGATRARASHACGVSGDALIVWGGFTNPIIKGTPGEVTAVYNLTTNTWVDKFIAPTVNRELFPPLTGPPNVTVGSGSDSRSVSANSGSGSNIVAIIGGVVAAVVVLAGLGCVVWRRSSLKKRTIFSNIHQQQSDGEAHNFKETAEKIRDPHSAPNVPPIPQSVPQSAPQNIRNPQLRTPWQEHARHQQSDDGSYNYIKPTTRNNNPHADLSIQRVPQILPRPTNSFRSPQLDISRRERELAAELEMLRSDRGNTSPVQHIDRWSINRSGGRSGSGGSPHA
ncbi:hypothetical protein CPC16_011581 [Podila verticillata]|nr:hypothetical protein CPC16_011581 [Podila verticillata]